MDGLAALSFAKRVVSWPWRWAAAIVALPQMKRDIEEMKRHGGDPLRCTACGKRLTVTAVRDMQSSLGDVMGEYLTLRCDTPGCVFTPRERDVRFPK